MKEFKIKLSADVGDLTNQFKAGSKELRKFAEGVSQAENKMEALSQTGEYLAQMDAQLAKLAKKYPNVFNQIFGTVDADIKKALAPIMQAPDLLSKSLSKIGEQLEGVLSGKIESEAIKISQLGKEVKAVTKALGAEVDLKFLDGSSKEETKAKKLINILAQLEKQYTSLGKITSGKYINEPKKPKKDKEPKESKPKETLPQIPDLNTSKVGDKLKEEHDKVKTQIDQLETQKNRYKEIIAALEGEEIKLKTKKSTDVAQLKELISQFDEASEAVKRFEAAKNTSGDEYKKALGEQYRLATLVKNTMDEVAEKGSSKGSLYVVSEVGKQGGAYERAEDILDNLKTSTAQEIKTVFTDILNSMENMTNTPVESVSGKVENIADSAKTAKTEVDALADSLKNTLIAASQLQVDVGKGNAPAKETMNLVGANGIISSVQGADYQVETQALIGQMLANLKENIIMSLHNHPDGMDAFTPSDIESFAKLYYGQGTKLNGIIADGLVKTIDFTGISQEVAIKISEAYSKNISDLASKAKGMFSFDQGDLVISDKIKELSQTKPNQYKQYMDIITSALDAALNDAFIQNGVESSLKGFTLEQMPELSSYIRTLQSSTEAALTPTEKLVNLFNSITPGSASNIGDFSEILEQFKSGAIDASKALEMMLEKQRALTQVENKVDASAIEAETNAIAQKITSYEELCQVVERYNALILKSHTEGQKLTQNEEAELSAINDRFAVTKGVNEDPDKFVDYAMNMSRLSGILGEFDANKLAQYLGVEIPQSAQQAQQAMEQAVQAFTDFQTLTSDIQSSWMTGTMNSEAVGKYTAQLEVAKTQLQEFANQGLVTAEQMEQVNSMYEESLKQINLSREINDEEMIALKAKPEYAGEPIGSYNSGFDDGYNQGQACAAEEIDELQKTVTSLQEELANAQRISMESASSGGTIDITAEKQALEDLRAKVVAVQQAVVAKNKAFNDEGAVVGAVVGKEINALNKLKGILDSINQVLTQQIAAYQQMQQWQPTNTSNNTPSNNSNNNSSGSKRQDSSTTEALKLLREEENLRVRIFGLEQKGANDADLQHLRDKIALYESLRGAIEDTMPDDVYKDYQVSAMSIEDLGDTKLTISQINADIKDRNNLEKDAITLLKEEYSLRNQISSLEKNGASAQEVDSLKQRADLYERIRNNIEQAMTSEQLVNYGSKAIGIKGKNDEKLTVNNIKSNIKERAAAEKADYNELLKLQKEYAAAQKDLEKTSDGQERDEIRERAVKAEEAYNNKKNQTNLTQEQTNELLQNELKLQQELKEIKVANADKEQKASSKKQAAADAKRIADAAKAQKQAEAEAKRIEIATQNAQLTGYKTDLSKRFNATKLNRDTATNEQKEFIKSYDALIQKIQEYSIARKQMSQDEKAALEAEIESIKQKLNAYTELDKTKSFVQGFGRTTNKKDTLSAIATSDEFVGSKAVEKQLNQMLEAYKRFEAKKNEIANMATAPTDADKNQYYQLSDQYTQAAKALEGLIAQSRKLEQMGTGNVRFVDPDRFTSSAEALKYAVERFHGKQAEIGKFNSAMTELSYRVKNADGTFSTFTAKLDSTGTKIVEVASKANAAKGSFGKFFDSIRSKFMDAMKVFSGYNLFFKIINEVRQGITYVKDIDSALTELKKVTDETDESYARFLQTMAKTGAEVGATVSNLTNMAANWARLGYSMEEAGDLAKSTAVLLNVSEFTDAEKASEALISTIQAYGYAAEDSMHVVDVLNEIGNNFAISSDGIATALQDSASALMSAGNNLEQSVAMVAAANKVLQDPSQVGGALRTISLRIRGTSVEVLEEMGEETDGVVESVSKLQSKIKGLTGVNILNDTGGYKDTYTIIKEIAEVWDDLTDINKAATLELLAGKNRSNAMAAMLTNLDDLTAAYEDAMNAQGSAEAENEKYLDSIQGKIEQFTNATQTMWMNALNSDTIKGFVDIGTSLIKVFDQINNHNPLGVLGGLAVAGGTLFAAWKGIPALWSAIAAASKVKIAAMTGETAAIQALNGQQILANIAQMDSITNDMKEAAMSAILTGAKGEEKIATNLVTIEKIKEALATKGVVGADAEAVLAAMGLTGANAGLSTSFGVLTASIWAAIKALLKFLFGTPVGWAILAAGAIIGVATAISNANREAAEAKSLETLSQNLAEIRDKCKELNSELSTVKDRIEELEGKDALSFTEDQELKKLQAQRIELERLISLEKEREKRQAKKTGEAFVEQTESLPLINGKTTTAYYDNNGKLVTWDQAVDTNLVSPDGTYNLKTGYTEGEQISSLQQKIKLYTQAKADVDQAKQELTEAMADDDTTDTKIKQLESNLNSAESNLQNLETTLSEYEDEYTNWLNQEGVEWQVADESGNLEDWQIAMNKRIQDMYDVLDAFAIARDDSGSAKESALDRIFKLTGADDEGIKKLQKVAAETQNLGTIVGTLRGNPQLLAYFNELGIDAKDVANYLLSVDSAVTSVGTSVESVGKAYSSYASTLEKFTNVGTIANEIIYDNIELTEEQGKALQELIGSEAEYAEAVDSSNGYIVKNAKLVKDLIAKKRNEAAYNAKTEKSQARLKYYELYKQIKKLSGANGELAQQNKAQINALYAEMTSVAKAVQQYSMLEQQLLGVTNAYTKFADAKEIDDANNYDSQFGEMIQALANAFNTGYLGTEQAQAAIAGLIPDEVIEKADTLDEKMQAVYDYFTGGPLSKYLTVEFDDEGSMTNAKISIDNLKQFVEDGINGVGEDSVKVFTGSWESFDLAPGIKSISDIADAWNMTEEAVFTFLQELEKTDISWIGGDFTTLLDKLMGDNLEHQAYKNTQALTELEVKLANGAITVEEYTKELYGLKGQLNSGAITQEEYNTVVADLDQQLADGTITLQEYQRALSGLDGAQKENVQNIRDNAVAWDNATTAVTHAKNKLSQATEELNDLREAGASDEEIQIKTNEVAAASKELEDALLKKYQLQEPTEMTLQLASDNINEQISAWKQENSALAVKAKVENIDDSELVKLGENGKYEINTELVTDPEDQAALQTYLDLINDQKVINILLGGDEDAKAQINEITTAAEAASKAIENLPDPSIDSSTAVSAINDLIYAIGRVPTSLTVTTTYKEVSEGQTVEKSGGANRVNGTAHATGDWGLKSNEHNTLVGELGQETVVDPHTGRYYTVGDNGAELVDLPKDAIIFNHKQTEELFKNGHINSRGKAYAEGNAHVDLVKKSTYGVNTWTKKVNQVPSDWGSSSAAAAASAAKAAEDAAEDVSEIFDWFEVLLEEINEQLDLMSAKLENAVGIEAKSSILGELLSGNHYKLTELNEGLKLYTDYAAKMLSKVPDEYKEMAKNGAVAITDFLGEANQETVEAINNYREWAQKVADLNQQLEETRTTISDLRVQTLDMIRTEYDNEIGLITTANDHIQSTIDLLEEKGQRSSSNFYTEMIANSEKQLDKLKEQREAMQKELDDAVASGDVKKYSEDWYDMLNAIYDVDSAIIDCKTDIEKFDNAILELHWENFEKIIDALDAVSDEAEQIRSIIDDSEITDDVGNWTKNGLTALGMAAQEMEKARYRADLYGKEIEQLNKDFSAGKYSQDEYNEKLKELKDAQWDSIEAYESAKDTLVDLNKTRVEAVKDGLQKEIDAYEKLIDKRKEDLNAQKDAHDWANTLKDRTDEIDKIQRQIDAMAGDTSAAANAQRKKLQEELANAQKELDETYYDRDIEMQQKALDDSLESYRQNKEDRMQELEDYLENEDQVVSDSYALILANTDAIASNLQEIAQRYGISISENVTAPWESGMTALGTYGEELDYATSSYVDMLEKVRKELIDLQIEADKTAAKLVKDINTSANQSQNANKTPAPSQSSTPAKSAPSLTTGSQVVVKPSATTFARDGGNGTRMQSWVPGGTFTVYQVSGDQVLIGLPGKGYTGWVRKQDIVGYAKGTTGVKKDQFAVIDENGLEELVMHADGGKLSYLTKGTAVVPNDLTNNIMKWGEIDPVAMLDRNKPSIGAPHIIENQMQIDMSIAEVVHIEHADRDSIPEIQDAVKKQLDSYMKNLNSGIKKYTR